MRRITNAAKEVVRAEPDAGDAGTSYAAEQARLVRYGSQGAASDVRRINPKTGRMIEILPRTR